MTQPAQLQELAERLLDARYPELHGTAAGPRLLPGALPNDLPFELPLPPESRLVGSFVGPSGGPQPGSPVTGRIIQVVVDVPTNSTETLEFYERAMAEHGWTPPPGEWRPYHRGFTSFSNLPPSRSFCHGARGPHLTITAHELPAGGTAIRMYCDTANTGPCASIGRRHPAPYDDDPIPALPAPEGVNIRSLGGGGGGDSWHSDARAVTNLSVDALEAHFAEHLVAGDWTRRNRGVEGRLAWSTWTVPGDAGWRGLLLVVAEPTPNRRYLHIRTELDAGPEPGTLFGWTSHVQS